MTPDSLVWNAAALAGILCFFLGLALILLKRGRAGLVIGVIVSLGGLMTCYSLAGLSEGKAAAAQYFGCLMVVLVLTQLSFWVFLVGEPRPDKSQRRN
jgi:hypothetical protein